MCVVEKKRIILKDPLNISENTHIKNSYAFYERGEGKKRKKKDEKEIVVKHCCYRWNERIFRSTIGSNIGLKKDDEVFRLKQHKHKRAKIQHIFFFVRIMELCKADKLVERNELSTFHFQTHFFLHVFVFFFFTLTTKRKENTKCRLLFSPPWLISLT